jgi:cell division protein FtsB
MNAPPRAGPFRRKRWAVPSIGTCIAIAAAGTVAAWLFFALAAQYLRTYDLGREAARLERRKQELLIQNATLYAEIRRLRTDDRYIERLAREQLGMVRPGEIEFVIVPAPSELHAARPQAPGPGARRQSARAASPFARRLEVEITSLRGWLRTTVSRVAPWLLR